MTEIEQIKKAIRNYNNPLNKQQFLNAESYLKKVYKIYGSIDLNIINDIIR